MQHITAIQALYSPDLDCVYPETVKNKKIGLMYKILLIFTPIIIIGCTITYFGAGIILQISSDSQYVGQAGLLQMTVPLLIFSFYSMLFGLPVLSVIDKVKKRQFLL